MKNKNSTLTPELKSIIDDYFYDYNESCSDIDRKYKNKEIDKVTKNKMKLEVTNNYNNALYAISNDYNIDWDAIIQYTYLV